MKKGLVMKNLLFKLKSSAGELKNASAVSVAGMLTAVSIVLSFYNLVISNELQFSFSFLPLAAGGMLYGPVAGGMIGVISDILGYFVRPNGPFFPGFTLSALISGLMYGFLLYKSPVSLKRIVIVSVLNTVIVNLFLTTLWLSMMYGNAFWALLAGRIVKMLIIFPVNTALLVVILKIAKRFEARGRRII